MADGDLSARREKVMGWRRGPFRRGQDGETTSSKREWTSRLERLGELLDTTNRPMRDVVVVMDDEHVIVTCLAVWPTVWRPVSLVPRGAELHEIRPENTPFSPGPHPLPGQRMRFTAGEANVRFALCELRLERIKMRRSGDDEWRYRLSPLSTDRPPPASAGRVYGGIISREQRLAAVRECGNDQRPNESITLVERAGVDARSA